MYGRIREWVVKNNCLGKKVQIPVLLNANAGILQVVGQRSKSDSIQTPNALDFPLQHQHNTKSKTTQHRNAPS